MMTMATHCDAHEAAHFSPCARRQQTNPQSGTHLAAMLWELDAEPWTEKTVEQSLTSR